MSIIPSLDKKDKIFIGVVALVHIVFFLMACRFTRIYMGDSMEYIYEALNIKHYFFFYSGNPALPIEPEYMTQRQPLYPLFLLGVYAFTINNWVVLVFQNILSLVNICYARNLLLKLGHSKRYDWLLMLLVVAYPAQFINASTIAPDILLQSCTLLYFGSFVALYQSRMLKHAIWMSTWLVAGLLVKPVLYPFVLPHIVILITVALHHKAKLQRPVLVALVPLCAVLLYNYWNFTRTGKFHFSSNQAFNALYYYYPYLGHKSGADSAARFLQREREAYNDIPEYKDRYDYANEQGVTMLKSNFAPYMAYHLTNSARMLIDPGKAEMDLFTGRLTYGRLYNKEQTGFFATVKQKGISGLGDYMKRNPSLPWAIVVLLFNCIRLLGFARFVFSRSIPGFVRTFIVLLVGYFTVAAGPIANTRYFLPVSLIVIGCAVIGLTNRKTKALPA